MASVGSTSDRSETSRIGLRISIRSGKPDWLRFDGLSNGIQIRPRRTVAFIALPYPTSTFRQIPGIVEKSSPDNIAQSDAILDGKHSEVALARQTEIARIISIF